MEDAGTDDAAERLTNTLLECMSACIPVRTATLRKCTHPWLTDEVLHKVQLKQQAEGTEREKEATQACSEAVLAAYRAYVQRVRGELLNLPRGSRKWWERCKQLSAQKSKESNVPALRDSQKNWHRTAEAKAQELADTFQGKYKLHQLEENEYTDLEQSEEQLLDWAFGTAEEAQRTLEQLKEDSATGPDGVPARVLKACAEELAVPFHKLSGRILQTGRWPAGWCVH